MRFSCNDTVGVAIEGNDTDGCTLYQPTLPGDIKIIVCKYRRPGIQRKPINRKELISAVLVRPLPVQSFGDASIFYSDSSAPIVKNKKGVVSFYTSEVNRLSIKMKQTLITNIYPCIGT